MRRKRRTSPICPRLRADEREGAMRTPHIVGIGGTTRPNSSTERALRFALSVCEQHGAATSRFAGVELAALPHYAPEDPTRADGALDLIEAIRRADGIVVA